MPSNSSTKSFFESKKVLVFLIYFISISAIAFLEGQGLLNEQIVQQANTFLTIVTGIYQYGQSSIDREAVKNQLGQAVEKVELSQPETPKMIDIK